MLYHQKQWTREPLLESFIKKSVPHRPAASQGLSSGNPSPFLTSNCHGPSFLSLSEQGLIVGTCPTPCCQRTCREEGRLDSLVHRETFHLVLMGRDVHHQESGDVGTRWLFTRSPLGGI